MRLAGYWLGAVLAGAMVLGSAACSSDADDNGGNPPPELEIVADAGTVVTLTDAQIARVLQVANEGEVMLGTFGGPLATDPAVRDFNNAMVTEHTAARQRLDALLQSQGITPEDSPLSLQLQDEVKQMLEILQGPDAPQGAAFDLALMSAQLNAHARTAFVGDSLLTPQVTLPALVQELQTERQQVQLHIQEAEEIQTRLLPVP
ncbi:DUF4142 domain-containing protein [Corallococcus praedator]|uniref:DUF4142 domain-containing protein n=1 Tax=Corallococcus praedator TaxID=2316724 RepID=A0ABX9QLM2_9BACT|nr:MULTISPECIES: DUF4142 domain-containing protein [Corallococcus]RKH17917.1 DUF4142 domain-containing protein [Corallococcus sp. CA047B]RKH36291.1 DUF4142 domain-containing protein [Corallococcus sp. CA031C]RKI12541.1 DUF4142 domain-containing protein [Corallococcus praedator]